MEAPQSRQTTKPRPKSPRPEPKKLAEKPIPPPPKREQPPERARTAPERPIAREPEVPAPGSQLQFDPLGFDPLGLRSEAPCGFPSTSDISTSVDTLASSVSLPSSSIQSSVPWPLPEALQVEAVEAKADRLEAEALERRLAAEEATKQKAEEEAKLRAMEDARQNAKEEAKLRAMEEAKQQAEEEAILAKQKEARINAEEEPLERKEEPEAKHRPEEARINAEEEPEARHRAEDAARLTAQNDEACMAPPPPQSQTMTTLEGDVTQAMRSPSRYRAATPPPKAPPKEVHPSSPSSRTPTIVEKSCPSPVVTPLPESYTPHTLHKFTTEQLRLIAGSKGLPRADRMERTHLMENIRQVMQWEKTCTGDLLQTIHCRGCPTPPGGSREGIIHVLIDSVWGDQAAKQSPPEPAKSNPLEETKGTAAEANPQPATTAAPEKSLPVPQPSPQPVLTSSGRSSSSSAKLKPELSPEEALPVEVHRINGANVGPRDFRIILGFTVSESVTLTLAQKRYRQLMLLLHPDKRTATGEARAGGREACEKAMERVTEAKRVAEQILGRMPGGGYPSATTAPPRWQPSTPNGVGAKPRTPPAQPPHPPPSAAPRHRQPPPPPPPGGKLARPFGNGPLDPLPSPHPNFGALRIVVVD